MPDDTCPRCHAPEMGAWRPVDAFTSATTGNQFRRRCASCGAVEMRAMRLGEDWMPAEPAPELPG